MLPPPAPSAAGGGGGAAAGAVAVAPGPCTSFCTRRPYDAVTPSEGVEPSAGGGAVASCRRSALCAPLIDDTESDVGSDALPPLAAPSAAPSGGGAGGGLLELPARVPVTVLLPSEPEAPSGIETGVVRALCALSCTLPRGRNGGGSASRGGGGGGATASPARGCG